VITLTVAVVIFAIFVIYFSGGLSAQQSYSDPITIYPINYASSCPGGVLVGAVRFNSTHAITQVSNDTLSHIAEKKTSLAEIYLQTIQSDQFLKLSDRHSWIPTSWTYYNLSYRPTVISQFVLLNQNGSIYGYLQSNYDLDRNYIQTMQVSGAHSCPAQ
jgi:hypothetical protein